MKTIAINGFGRIGRAIFRALEDHKDFKVIKINDLADKETLGHLLNYDSVYGHKDYDLSDIEFSSNKEPGLSADIVFESTGKFTNKADASKHDAKIVLITAPVKSGEVPHYIRDINCHSYKGEQVVAAASCTTVASAYVLKILHDKFGVQKVAMTTIHGYTSTQNLVDGPHKDLRRARAAAINIIPTTTGAAIAVEQVIPALKGRISAKAIRVPIPTVSLLEISAILEKETDIKELNNSFEYKSDKPLVSSDYIKDSRPAIIDASFTKVNGNFINLLAWYDNEFGYSAQAVRLLESIV